MQPTQIGKKNLAFLRKIAFAASNNRITMPQMVNLFCSDKRKLSTAPQTYINNQLYRKNGYLSHVERGVYELTPKAYEVLSCR